MQEDSTGGVAGEPASGRDGYLGDPLRQAAGHQELGGLGGAEPFEPSERVRGRSDDLNRRIGGLLLYGQPGVHAPRLPGGQVFAQFAFRGRDDYFAFGGQPMGERGERQHGILSIRDETRLPRAGQQTVDAGTAARLPGLGRDRLAIGVER